MTIEYNDAIDEMFALFNAYWNANTSAIAGYIPEVRWIGNETDTKPNGSKHWARVSTQNLTEVQATLSNCVGIEGQKHYEANGLIFVQLFAPKQVDNSFEECRKLAQIAKKAFRGKTTPGKIWFRNVRINELAPDNLFYRINVVGEYEFDELG